MPGQLFYTTGIPVCLWFLTRDKSGRHPSPSGRGAGGEGRWRDRKGETLFIDARKLGTMQTRTLRVLSDGAFTAAAPARRASEGHAKPLADAAGWCAGDLPPTSDIGRIVYAFRQWRGEPTPKWWKKKEHGEWKYRDVPGFCKATTTTAEIEKHAFVLTPGRYVGAEEQEDDGEPFAEKFPRLVAELEAHFGEGERLTALVRSKLEEIGHNG